MKNRLNSLDIRCIVSDLQSLVGSRLVNVYDISAKTYLFKFSSHSQNKSGNSDANSDANNTQEDTHNTAKRFLLVESGIRLHLTEYGRDKNVTPSSFAMKLRKHLRTLRLNSLHQLGTDRIVDLQFGENFHLIFEFYAAGNIILTDKEYRIIALLRFVTVPSSGPSNEAATQTSTQDDSVRFAVGQVYDTSRVKQFTPISIGRLRDALIPSSSNTNTDGGKDEQSSKKKTNKDTKKSPTLRKSLRDAFAAEYSAAVVEHCLLSSNLDPSTETNTIDTSDTSPQLHSLLQSFQWADEFVANVDKYCKKGYILLRNGAYDDFYPYMFDQLKTLPVITTSTSPTSSSTDLTQLPTEKEALKEFSTFTAAVDDFYSNIESQKLQIRSQQMEMNAQKKLDAIRLAQEAQVKQLEVQQVKNERAAQAVEANIHVVEQIINTMRQLVASGMDWQDISTMIQDESKRGNYLASMIVGLRLDVGMVTVRLMEETYGNESDDDDDESDDDEDDDDDDDEEDQDSKDTKKPQDKSIPVEIDIYSSAYANIRRLHSERRTAQDKAQKTVQASAKALKSAEQKIESELKGGKPLMTSVVRMRKIYWFEKFYWFITSENYLVVGGRDAQQNEMLVKKHLRKGDAYVHADLHGAPSVIVKNTMSPDTPIPPLTLQQAGTMALCYSRAWESKIVSSAYWVESWQVSKTAPSGEYLTTGSFMIRGKKNYLPPSQLVYGVGVLFKYDETDPEAVGRHRAERLLFLRGVEEGLGKDDMASQKTSSYESLIDSNDVNVSNDAMDTQGNKNDGNDVTQETEEKEEDDEFEFPDTEIDSTISRLKNLSTNKSDEDAANDDDEDETNGTGDSSNWDYLTYLTGQPHSSDTLLFAMLMCAPYNALTKYKYKAKLLPGALKKGKAVKSVLSLFGDSKKDDDEVVKREKELMKSVKEEEVVPQMLGKVKVMGAAASDEKKKGGKGKKGKK